MIYEYNGDPSRQLDFGLGAIVAETEDWDACSSDEYNANVAVFVTDGHTFVQSNSRSCRLLNKFDGHPLKSLLKAKQKEKEIRPVGFWKGEANWPPGKLSFTIDEWKVNE